MRLVPGGNADSTARIFAEACGQRLGQPFVIDNRGGAGGYKGAGPAVQDLAFVDKLAAATDAVLIQSGLPTAY
ncbi:tripartite tricarboxylate transporter substrate-binding protein [Paracidovorax cattleyae]|uniref:Tripartite tricarboxylate transporter family receptor n=2 Tax=Paracidovorax cattleyae TaxID=80868 RepID=A0A1H0M4V1_9BURK|nr:tripartite tricarboxylate transporter substrate-binding protein [Paracidovorax cattleyae]AVS74225.1 hypothetical protein C8240_09505 [Paracidovorax cattleyae]MBF9263562.1 hypothetical protein [Paracidovorax cattleyae]SDO75522.1 Tripartite tricarboxylate transporter family receptor [Paracidovorax cattleyae]